MIAAIVIEIVWLPGVLVWLPGVLFIRHDSRPGRGSWLNFFSWLEIIGGLAGAGVGWVIAKLLSGY